MAVTFVPNTPEWMADPHASYRELREQDPVHWSETLGHWVLTRYEDVASVLKDERFSAANRAPQRRWDRPTTMVTADPPDHGRLRKSVRHRFSLTSVNAQRPRIQEIVDQLLDAVEPASDMEVVQQLARPLPRTVMLELLGVPEPTPSGSPNAPTPRVAEPHGGSSAGSRLRGVPLAPGTAMPSEAFFQEAIEKHREELTDDLLGELLKAETGREMSPEEVLDTAVILYGAGQETTAKMIANGLFQLLRHPAELEKLRGNPGLIDSATEELLRFDSPVHAITRRATEDVDVGGTTIQQGDKALCVLAAANHDPEVFHNPNELDISRANNPHIAFGTGIHACLGATLARVEIQIAIATMLARFPKLRLATDDVDWEGSFIIRGVASLPVTFL
ncbi:MAG: cytochrome P450 [Chloroflexi bacterium]|nr:cytochrome P450 [Chloroflexota bacterium]